LQLELTLYWLRCEISEVEMGDLPRVVHCSIRGAIVFKGQHRDVGFDQVDDFFQFPEPEPEPEP
jgi:hypothetical protein